jgi:hypothetical protein
MPSNSIYLETLPTPLVLKRCSDGCVACDLRVYVDDGSTTAPSNEESWQTFRVVAITLTWLGLQDAAHKCHPPSQEPGTWAGSIVHSSHGTVIVLVSQENKNLIDYFKCAQHAGQNPVTHHTTLSHRDWVTIDYKHTLQSIHSTPGRSTETYPTTLSHRDWDLPVNTYWSTGWDMNP